MSKETRFELYDLKISVDQIRGECTCQMKVGDYFLVKGGKMSLPDGQNFCLYALHSTLPVIPAKQRQNHQADWIETDSRILCPDPHCQLIMRIERIGQQSFEHNDVSGNKI